MEFTESGLTVTMPTTEELWSMFQWWHVFVVTGVYGFVTHFKTLPAIHRYNKGLTEGTHKDIYELHALKLFGVLLLRMSLVLPWRIVCFIVGIFWIFFSFVSSGVPAFRNGALKEAWLWTMTADQLAEDWKAKT